MIAWQGTDVAYLFRATVIQTFGLRIMDIMAISCIGYEILCGMQPFLW